MKGWFGDSWENLNVDCILENASTEISECDSVLILGKYLLYLILKGLTKKKYVCVCKCINTHTHTDKANVAKY